MTCEICGKEGRSKLQNNEIFCCFVNMDNIAINGALSLSRIYLFNLKKNKELGDHYHLSLIGPNKEKSIYAEWIQKCTIYTYL